MQIHAASTEEYLKALPADRQDVMQQLLKVIRENLPVGFEETIGYGMISWVVPHSIYPAGYHCNPKQALPFLSLASQKNNISLYHMGIYSSTELMDWFNDNWAKHSSKKPDMGKSCLRFKKPADIPFKLVGELCSKMSPEAWISCYESVLRK